MCIPKSLHTVTAVVNVASHIRDLNDSKPFSVDEQVDYAFRILGYLPDDTDPHRLREKCIVAVERDINQEKISGT